MPKSTHKGLGKLRIIGGVWRRHLLAIPDEPGLRPTPDRVRETLFNWLGQDCSGYSVLDLYSGTGALGFEAASRGAATVDFIESHREVVRCLKNNAQTLLSKWSIDGLSPPKLKVIEDHVAHCLPSLASQYDLIFLDPPFGGQELEKVLPFLRSLLKPAGLIYIEWGEALFDDLPGLAHKLQMPEIDALRHIRAGQVHGHLVGLPTL